MAPQRSNPSLPLKTRIFISFLSNLTDAACRSDGSINRRLLRLFDFQVAPIPTPNPPTPSPLLTPPSMLLVISGFESSLLPPSDILLPVVFYFHGGGFHRLHQLPSRSEHTYRPNTTTESTFKFLDDNRDVYLPENADFSRCFLAGDSAGGNIAHNVAVRACKTEFKTLKLRGLICIQPFFGGEERTEAEVELEGAPLISISRSDFFWRALLPKGSSNRDHPAVNVSGPNAENIKGLDFPATMVVVAGFDPLKDWQRRYYEWLKASGKKATLIEYPNSVHAFHMFPELQETSQLIMKIKDFMSNCSSKLPISISHSLRRRNPSPSPKISVPISDEIPHNHSRSEIPHNIQKWKINLRGLTISLRFHFALRFCRAIFISRCYSLVAIFKNKVSLATTIASKLSPAQRQLFEETCFGPWLRVQHPGGDANLTHLWLQTMTSNLPDSIQRGRYTRHIARPSWLSRVFPDESMEKPNLHVDDLKKLFNKKMVSLGWMTSMLSEYALYYLCMPAFRQRGQTTYSSGANNIGRGPECMESVSVGFVYMESYLD
ncbi:putative carboxylesterase 18 [Hibiscus syriacus]|uniref:Carboxylesterase 18 n=1 Tax=Hibiscus syriacus TaxID=106335 RepID=A0A6A3BNQ9_HIBSY|nr:putative carboxylesterase 18 [Hibiscus syriacus]